MSGDVHGAASDYLISIDQRKMAHSLFKGELNGANALGERVCDWTFHGAPASRIPELRLKAMSCTSHAWVGIEFAQDMIAMVVETMRMCWN
jgi:hypothetical protein